MRLPSILALLLVTACGEAGVYEPHVLPDGALDLNATPIKVSVYTNPALTQDLLVRNLTIDGLRVVARMTGTDGFAPTVNLPSDPTKPLLVSELQNGVQDQSSTQPTEIVVLRGYPVGRLDVEVQAFAGGERVGLGCDIGKAIDAVPAASHVGTKTTAKVVLGMPESATCLP